MMVLAFRSRYQLANPLTFVLVTITCGIAVAAGSEPTQVMVFPGEDVDLRSAAELKTLVSGDFLQPSARDVVESLKAQTGVSLVLDVSVITDRPIQGVTRFANIPAWGVMEQLARNKYVLGKWRRVGAEYRLFATYTGPLPPVPPAVPPAVANAIRKNTPLTTSVPAPEPVQPTGRPILGLTAVGLLLLALLGLGGKYLRWIRKSGGRHLSGNSPSS